MAGAEDLEHIPFSRLTPEQRIIRWDAEAGKPTRFVAIMRRILAGADDATVEEEFDAEAGSAHVYRLALHGQLSRLTKIDMSTVREKETGRIDRRKRETAVRLLRAGVPAERVAQMVGARAEVIRVLGLIYAAGGGDE